VRRLVPALRLDPRDLDDLNTGGTGSPDHVGSATAAGKSYHKGRASFVKHLLVADWSRLTAKLGPVSHVYGAWYAADPRPLLGHRIGAFGSASDDPGDSTLAMQSIEGRP
jgi:hypothetical protein